MILPESWAVFTIGEIGDVYSGGTPSTTNQIFWNGPYSWITPVDLSGYDKKHISKGRKSITIEGLKKSSAVLLPKGTVLFSCRAPIGYVAIADTELSTNQGFKSVVPYEGILSDYVYYYLKASKQLAEKHASGTTFKEISLKAFSNLPIPIPPLAEQHRIVTKIEELFSELDKGIEMLQTARQQLKVYRQAVLKWAFEGRLTNPDVKDGIYPSGWDTKSFGECTINFDGKRIPISKELRSKRKGNFRYYGATEIVDYIDDFLFDGCYMLIGEDGANLLTKSKPLAHIVDGQFWVNNHAHVVQPEKDISIKYLCNYINSIHLDPYVSGTAQPKLNQANMNKIPVPFPLSLTEQELIVEEIESRISVCDKVEEIIEQSLMEVQALRQSILKKAFEGKLTVQDPEDEPASVLLKQIKANRTQVDSVKIKRSKTSAL